MNNKVDAGSETDEDDNCQAVIQLSSELVQHLQLQSYLDHLDKVKVTYLLFISIVYFYFVSIFSCQCS